MKPAANGVHERETRTRVGPVSLLLLLLAALAPVLAEASVPRTTAGDVGVLRAASLAEPSRLAPLTASHDVERFALFAGDDLARERARGSRAASALTLAPGDAGDLALASLALAYRMREESFSLHLGADVFGVESLRGPPPLSEDLCQGDDECLAGTRIGGLGLLEPFAQEAEPELTLGLLPGYKASSSGLAYGKPLDPWGLRAPTVLDRRDRDSIAGAYDAAIADFEGTGRFLGEEGRNIDTAALQKARAYSLGSFDAAVAAADENERVIRGGGRSFGARFWSLDPGVYADAFEVEKPWKDVAWAVVEQGVHGVNALVYAATIRGLTKQPVSGGVGARTFERSQSEQLVEAPSTESGLRAVNPVLPTRPGRPVGHVNPPEGETFGTARFGQKIEGPIQRWLEEQFPESDFFVRTGKGRTGIDAQAVGPKDPGFGFAEIKPRTPSGQKKFMSQMERWGRKPGPGPVPGPENTISLTYDAEGNIYVGW